MTTCDSGTPSQCNSCVSVEGSYVTREDNAGNVDSSQIGERAISFDDCASLRHRLSYPPAYDRRPLIRRLPS